MIRELTWYERAVWGTCPVCGAQEDTLCTEPPKVYQSDYVKPLADPNQFVHAARFDAAPTRVKMEGIE